VLDWSRQAGSDVLMNFVRPSLVQTLSLVAVLVMQFLNASCRAGGTMPLRQLTSSVRPDELSSPLTPVFEMQAVACSFALATADDDAMGVVVPVPPPGLVVVLLLQPTIAATAAAAITVRTRMPSTLVPPPRAGLHLNGVMTGRGPPPSVRIMTGLTRRRRRAVSSLVMAAFVAPALVAALAGCSSGPPSYCSNRDNLQNSVNGLKNLNASSGVSGLKSQLDKIQTDATNVVNSAKSDFPTQTSTITTSVDALKSSVSALTTSPSAAQIATVTKDAASVVSSVKSFTDASSSKCS